MSDEKQRWRSQEAPRCPRAIYRVGRPNIVKPRSDPMISRAGRLGGGGAR